MQVQHWLRPDAAASHGLLGANSPPAAVLEFDPDLANGVPDEERPVAARAARATRVNLDEGPYDFYPTAEPGAMGALILEGLITIRLNIAERGHVELLGPGDLIQPWAGCDDNLVAAEVWSTVAMPTELAFLDRGFVERTARWPEIHAAILNRLIDRLRRLSFQAAINSLPRVDDRLEITLWQIAGRLGRVTSDGVSLILPLTHCELGELVGAQRPSVTTGLRRLVEENRVLRTGRQSWLLPRAEPDALVRIDGPAVTPA